VTSESDFRLPRTAVPSHYRLTFEPDLAAASFVGSAMVDIEVVAETDALVLNAIELEITAAALVDEAGHRREAVGIEYDEARERVTLRFSSTITPGPWKLSSDFTGVLNDKLRGFYRSTYTGDDGGTKTIATTQFEATDARRAFPCWDEPDLKATFGIALVVPAELTAVSNGAVVAEEPVGDAKKRVSFADTMVMSTYLVAMVVGDLEATDPVDVDGVPLRVLHTPGKAHLAGFALECGAFALRYFADYYEIPYPGDKVDMIGIPDFAWGAMENLGAITYRETALLVDPATSSPTCGSVTS
jgi:puromycin-sensitive aminopeptidase